MFARVLCRSIMGFMLLSSTVFQSQTRAQAQAPAKEPGPCCGQEEGKTNKTAAALANACVCPQYIYMNHGTYVSYYATVCGNVVGTCGTPISFDGPSSGVALHGDCKSGTGCLASFVKGTTEGARPKHRSHEADDSLVQNGIPANQDPTDTLQPGSRVLNTGVDFIEFRKNTGAGGQLMKARIFLVEVDPANAQPPSSGEKVIVGNGYSIANADHIDRSAADDDVVTLRRDANSHVVNLMVKIRDNEWREYQIILRNGENH